MDFSAHLAKADKAIAQHLGGSAIYHPLNGDKDLVDVIIEASVEQHDGPVTLSATQFIAELPRRDWNRGDELVLNKTGERYRVHGYLDEDESWLRLLVTPLGPVDLQDVQEAFGDLNDIANNREW